MWYDAKLLRLVLVAGLFAASCTDEMGPTGPDMLDDPQVAYDLQDPVAWIELDTGYVSGFDEPLFVAPAGLWGSLTGPTLHAARRAKRLSADVVESEWIDPEKGGKIDVKAAGLKLVIPEGALNAPADGSEEVLITVRAHAGKYHVYEFLPHGIVFNAPVRVEFEITQVKKFSKKLEKRLKELEKLQRRCDKRAAEGKEPDRKCRELDALWADFNEDQSWYDAAVDATGFRGVYFRGEVRNGSPRLDVLELFPVRLEGDELIFDIRHFSGYALASG